MKQVHYVSGCGMFALCLGGRSNRLVCNALQEWTDPQYAAEVLSRFPEDGVASTEEAMVLLKNGYEWLDVRTKVFSL